MPTIICSCCSRRFSNWEEYQFHKTLDGCGVADEDAQGVHNPDGNTQEA